MSFHVACPAEQAFDLMADARNEVRWNLRVSRSELVSGDLIGAGSRFLTVNRGQECEAIHSHLTVDDADAASLKLLALGHRQLVGMRKEDEIV